MFLDTFFVLHLNTVFSVLATLCCFSFRGEQKDIYLYVNLADYNCNMNLEYSSFTSNRFSFTKAINTSVLYSCQHFILMLS